MPDDVERRILEGARTALVDAMADSSLAYRPEFVSNDRRRGSKVLCALESELMACDGFLFSVAFVTPGGVEPLNQAFAELARRGVRGRMLTTDYQLFNDPRTLRWLSGQAGLDVRMFETGQVSGRIRERFHTKGYLFHRPDGTVRAIIGSSNLTEQALTSNREWNARLVSTARGELVETLRSELEDLWAAATPLDDILDAYERIFRAKRRAIAQTAAAGAPIPIEQVRLEPNAMQAAFVDSMVRLRARGQRKALLVSATGTGKTYTSAFALRDENPRRALFLAHREQILRQAMKSYRIVLGAGKTFGLLSGTSRDLDADYLFATMQTMRSDEVLQRFSRDAFDTIVIDEVHHAGAPSYQKIMDYFDARMVLGMTASPDRPDAVDIYGMFDHNIACEIRLQQAPEYDLLCPFHYFGITDIAFAAGEVDEVRDFNRLVEDKRVDYILRQASFYGYPGDRVHGLVFCSRLEEAEALSRAFARRGLRCAVLSGASSQAERLDVVDRLSAGPHDAAYARRLDYVFSVDVFNEGIDIPQVNQVIMLRPTQSPIVFVQQLGRGLRKAQDKDFVVILDFIGNYTNNYMIPLALSGDRSYDKDAIRRYVMEGSRVIPGYSSIHFDEIARRRIFDSIDQATTPLRLLAEKYFSVKNRLGRVPRMVDFLQHGEIDPLLFVDKKGSYQAFVSAVDSECGQPFSVGELMVLEYLSKFVANGMRPHELLMLQMLLEGRVVDERGFGEVYHAYCSLDVREDDYRSARNVLSGAFVGSPGDRRRYGSLEIVDLDAQGMLSESTSFHDMLGDEAFSAAVLDIVSFGLARNEERYASADGPFVLYEKYTRKDVCRLLDWDRDYSSTVYGYRTRDGSCPIFVTYRKADGISSSTRYEDEFIDQDTFSWMTRSNRTLASREVREIVNARETGLKVYLFVKKSDDEGVDFYYLGHVEPACATQRTIADDAGRELPIVNIQLKLEHPVREDYYDYFAHAAE